VVDRVRQVWTFVECRGAIRPPSQLAATPRTARLFAHLDLHDQRHLIAVHRACIVEGVSVDIAMAGLLHDVGKTSLSGRPVTLLDRTLRVLLARFTLGLLRRLSSEPALAWRLGLLLAERHAQLGASRLEALGWPDAVVAAVREHESTTASGELAVLQRIDDATA
jgi:hypothetical protein